MSKKNILFAAIATLAIFTTSSCGDDDCAGETWYEDSDGDGFGNPNNAQDGCQPDGFVDNNEDFDDANAQINRVWQSGFITFTKANNADFTQADSQDRITDNVWITRGDTRGIYNFATENSYVDFSSPEDTEWAYGTTADIGTLTFEDWESAVGGPPNSVDKDMVVHLITDNIFIDIKFNSWTSGMGAGGGGFSYTRASAQ